MSTYIVCQMKRNNPRMDIRICERKCEDKGECQAYLAHKEIVINADKSALSAESHTTELAA